MEAVVSRPNIAELVLRVIAGDSVEGKEGVEDLGGEVGKEAGLGGRIDGECGIEKRCDDDGGDEDDANLVRCTMPASQWDW